MYKIINKKKQLRVKFQLTRHYNYYFRGQNQAIYYTEAKNTSGTEFQEQT